LVECLERIARFEGHLITVDEITFSTKTIRDKCWALKDQNIQADVKYVQ
jgi:hypothetical protein